MQAWSSKAGSVETVSLSLAPSSIPPQTPGGGAVVVGYFPRDESEPEPTGKCPNCGDLCYNGQTCCSDACHSAYVAYCSNPGGWF
jgi:hypothetical protein